MLIYELLPNRKFQHTAARRRLVAGVAIPVSFGMVSTHSRPKAAGKHFEHMIEDPRVSTHSRPKAAGSLKGAQPFIYAVSTHSRPKAAGPAPVGKGRFYDVSTHSRPKAAGWWLGRSTAFKQGFNTQPPEGGWPLFVPYFSRI